MRLFCQLSLEWRAGGLGVFQFHSQELDNLSIHLIFIPFYLNISRSLAKAGGDQETAHCTSLHLLVVTATGHWLMQMKLHCCISCIVTYPHLGRTRFARSSF